MAIFTYEDSSANEYIDRSTNEWADFDSTLRFKSQLTQQWHLYTVVQQELVQRWAIKLGSELSQLWSITQRKQSKLDQIWGIYIASKLTAMYEDAANPINALVQYYGDAGIVSKALVQRWDDALICINKLDQPYHLYDSIRNQLTVIYALTGETVRNELVQLFDLRDRDELRNQLTQYWSILNSDAVNLTPEIHVRVRGINVLFSGFQISSSRSDFRKTATITVLSPIEYAKFNHEDPVEIRLESDIFQFIVTKKHRPSISNEGTVYQISVASKSILLTTPYSVTLNQSYDPAMAATLATDIASPKNITVDWQGVNWYVSADKLYATNDAPLDVIRKLSAVPKLMLQSAMGGDLKVKKRYAVPISQWATASPSFTFTTSHFINITENPLGKPGYNRIMVSDQLTSSDKAFLDDEDINAYTKLVKGFIVPWDDGLSPQLLTSGGGWVNVVLEGVRTETLVEEEISFENGSANVSKPIYDLISVDWRQESLGGITFSEDGKLRANYIDGPTLGCSLATVTYQTKYMTWTVTSDRIESVQFILYLED